MTRTKLRNGNLLEQNFFQLEIKPKLSKEIGDPK